LPGLYSLVLSQWLAWFVQSGPLIMACLVCTVWSYHDGLHALYSLVFSQRVAWFVQSGLITTACMVCTVWSSDNGLLSLYSLVFSQWLAWFVQSCLLTMACSVCTVWSSHNGLLGMYSLVFSQAMFRVAGSTISCNSTTGSYPFTGSGSWTSFYCLNSWGGSYPGNSVNSPMPLSLYPSRLEVEYF
jgi:hypothetical protein